MMILIPIILITTYRSPIERIRIASFFISVESPPRALSASNHTLIITFTIVCCTWGPYTLYVLYTLFVAHINDSISLQKFSMITISGVSVFNNVLRCVHFFFRCDIIIPFGVTHNFIGIAHQDTPQTNTQFTLHNLLAACAYQFKIKYPALVCGWWEGEMGSGFLFGWLVYK